MFNHFLWIVLEFCEENGKIGIFLSGILRLCGQFSSVPLPPLSFRRLLFSYHFLRFDNCSKEFVVKSGWFWGCSLPLSPLSHPLTPCSMIKVFLWRTLVKWSSGQVLRFALMWVAAEVWLCFNHWTTSWMTLGDFGALTLNSPFAHQHYYLFSIPSYSTPELFQNKLFLERLQNRVQ